MSRSRAARNRKANWHKTGKRVRAYIEVLRRDPCCYCGQRKKRNTIDHILSIHFGGKKNSWENATGACSRCNELKRDMSLLSFLLEQKCLMQQ